MTFGAGNTIGIQSAAGVCFAVSGHGGHVLAEIQPVIVIPLTLIVLSNQLQLTVVVKFNCPGAHDVQTIGVL